MKDNHHLPTPIKKLKNLFGSIGRPVLPSVTVEYLASQMNSGKRNGVENAAGLIIYSLEKDLPVPAGFISSRRREVMRQTAECKRAKEEARQALEAAYMRWVDGKRQEALAERYSARNSKLNSPKSSGEITKATRFSGTYLLPSIGTSQCKLYKRSATVSFFPLSRMQSQNGQIDLFQANRANS